MKSKNIEDLKTESELKSFANFYQNKNKDVFFKELISEQEREQILFAQYDMEKKGKNFGTSQLRLFRIQKKQNQLYQVDKNNQTKLLPFPINLNIQTVQEKYQQEWNPKFITYSRRIRLNFQQRSQIYIYFKKISACNQVAAYLSFIIFSKSNQKNLSKHNLLARVFNATQKKYQNKLVEYAFYKALNAKKYQVKKKVKQEIIQTFKQNLNDKKNIQQLLQNWYKKCLKQIKEKSSEKQTQMKLNLQSFHIFFLNSKQKNYEISKSTLIINDTVHFSIPLKISQQITEINNENKEDITYTSILISNYQEIPEIQLFKTAIKVKITDQISFQISVKTINNQIYNEQIWKSQKLSIFNLLHSEIQNQRFQISLTKRNQNSLIWQDKEKIAMLKLQINFQKNLKHSKNLHSKKQINFQHRALIQELFLSKNQNQSNIEFQMEYQKIFNDQQQKNSYTCVSFNKIDQLSQMLKIPSIIEKFYKATPFNQLQIQNQIKHKGSFVFNFLLKKSKGLKFYDVEKLIWKFKNLSIRNLLSALKSFDQVPKINFTEPFYHLCNRVRQIVTSQIYGNSKNQNFQNNVWKTDSISFFIVLGIIKMFSSIFIYQKSIEKRSLQWNSLLFLLILKKQMKSVYNKIIPLQLNIQAIFGIQFTSLLSKYFHNDHKIFFKILEIELQNCKTKKTNIFHSIIGIFLALMEQVDKYKFPYLGAQSYLLALQYASNHIQNPIQFYQNIEKHINISRKYQNDQDYITISRQLLKISANQTTSNSALSEDFGTIAKQIYEQFSLNQNINARNINSNDIDNHNRKFYLIIDSIQLDQNVDKMMIELIQYQKSKYQQLHHNLTSSSKYTVKLYQHEYKRVDPFSLHQFIDISLQRMESIRILIHTKNASLYCDLDLKNHPSNCYFHKIQNLMISRQTIVSSKQNDKQSRQVINFEQSICKNNHIAFQFYIKDSSPYEHLENIIPHQYHNTFLYNSQIKKYIIEVRKYLKNCRMRQANFNLLYTKLGWYGCHYSIPHERILKVFKPNATNSLNNQINLQYFQLAYYTNCLFGRAILPKTAQRDGQNKIFSDIIKNQIRRIHSNDFSVSQNCQYNSEKSLIGYTSECFSMDNIESFFQFYVKLCELPLIQYLLYQPMNFYILPPINFQMSYLYEFGRDQFKRFNCTINIMSFTTLLQVFDIKLDYKKDEIDLLQKDFIEIFQELKNEQNLIIEELNFYYPEENFYIDNFMLILKANIMHKIIEGFYRNYRNETYTIQSRVKEVYAKKLTKNTQNYILNLEIQQNEGFVNTETYYLFRFMNQTKSMLKLNLRKQKYSQQKYTHKKHNQTKQFKKWAILEGMHKKIQILCVQRQSGPNEKPKQYVVEEQITRKIHKITEEFIVI